MLKISVHGTDSVPPHGGSSINCLPLFRFKDFILRNIRSTATDNQQSDQLTKNNLPETSEANLPIDVIERIQTDPLRLINDILSCSQLAYSIIYLPSHLRDSDKTTYERNFKQHLDLTGIPAESRKLVLAVAWDTAQERYPLLKASSIPTEEFPLTEIRRDPLNFIVRANAASEWAKSTATYLNQNDQRALQCESIYTESTGIRFNDRHSILMIAEAIAQERYPQLSTKSLITEC